MNITITMPDLYHAKLSIAIATLCTATLATIPVYGANISYDFTVNVTKGALAGKSFNGTFSYDDSALKRKGIEELGIERGLTVCMNYLGRKYSETDDSSYPKQPKLIFENGEIKQLDFWIQPQKRVNWWKLPGWDVKLSMPKAVSTVSQCQKPTHTVP